MLVLNAISIRVLLSLGKNKKDRENTPYFHLYKGATFLLASSVNFPRIGPVDCHELTSMMSLSIVDV
jgi:hypothetical protein